MNYEVRPRLTLQQLEYLVSVLKWYEADLEEKIKEIDALQREIILLRREVRVTGDYHKRLELVEKKERLQHLQRARYYDHRWAVQGFVRRFEGLLNRKKLHFHDEWLLRSLSEMPLLQSEVTSVVP